MSPASASFITPDALLSHWQAHRRLTRRVIEAFPDDKLFTFSVGGMRTFGELSLEMVTMGAPMLRGLTGGNGTTRATARRGRSRRSCGCGTRRRPQIDALWKKIPAERFHETATAFGQFTAPMHDLILYVIDNEIHHRGQGYVYLRALGIEPPPFYDRS